MSPIARGRVSIAENSGGDLLDSIPGVFHNWDPSPITYCLIRLRPVTMTSVLWPNRMP
jgi:hypothetical protein